MRGWILSCALALVIVSCGDGEAQDQSDTTALRQPSTTSATTLLPTTTVAVPAGCDAPLAEPGEYEGLNPVGDVEQAYWQAYWVVVPETYVDVAPAPLYLHLASGDGGHNSFLAGWRPQLDDLDGLMVMVNTAPGVAGKRDPETMVALIDQISAEYCVDSSRVHVMGTSSSFEMADRLACEAPERIASFVAALGDEVWPDCTPDRPVPLLTFTGDGDRPGVTALVDKWVSINGCDPDPTVEDLGSGVFRKTFENCEADIVYFDIEGMGHAWPMHEAIGPGARFVAEYAEVDYLEEAFRFFADHPLP